LGILATLGTYSGKHLTSGSITNVSIAFCFPCLTTFRAAFRLVGITPGLEKFLIVNAEDELSPTIGTLE
jgi:hypothetical protein